MVGCHVVRDVVEDQAQASVGERFAGGGEGIGPAEACVDDVLADAVGGADHVVGSWIGDCRAIAAVYVGIAERDLESGGAALPDALSQTASTGSAASASHRSPGTSLRVSARPR